MKELMTTIKIRNGFENIPRDGSIVLVCTLAGESFSVGDKIVVGNERLEISKIEINSFVESNRINIVIAKSEAEKLKHVRIFELFGQEFWVEKHVC